MLKFIKSMLGSKPINQEKHTIQSYRNVIQNAVDTKSIIALEEQREKLGGNITYSDGDTFIEHLNSKDSFFVDSAWMWFLNTRYHTLEVKCVDGSTFILKPTVSQQQLHQLKDKTVVSAVGTGHYGLVDTFGEETYV